MTLRFGCLVFSQNVENIIQSSGFCGGLVVLKKCGSLFFFFFSPSRDTNRVLTVAHSLSWSKPIFYVVCLMGFESKCRYVCICC